MAWLLDDARTGFRTLRKRPAISLTAIVALAIGIGANSAVFTVVDAALLRPLPYPNADRVVAVWSTPVGAHTRWTSCYPDFADWRASARSFDALAAYTADRQVLRTDDGPTSLAGLAATHELFDVLGVRPALGRAFTADEDRIGGAPAVVLADDAWRRLFRADPNVVGTAVALGGRSVTVVGVMPRGFSFGTGRSRVDYYMPLALAVGDKIEHRSDLFLRAVGLLAPGVTADAAGAELAGIGSQLEKAYPASNANRTAWARSYRDDLVGDSRPALFVLFGAVALVLLIACANVANLLLAGATARRREMAVRSALGARRARIARQLLVESALLVVAGSGAGLLLAAWAVDALARLAPASIPGLAGAGLDARALAFTIVAGAVTTLAAGLAPALQGSRTELTDTLKEGGRSASDGRRVNRTRSALVVAQVALSVTLLVGAGLLVRSFVALRGVDPGFDAENVVTTSLAPSRVTYADAGARNRLFERVVDALSATPGVETAACVSPLPFGGSSSDTQFSVVGRPAPERGKEPIADNLVASAGYFDAMRVPVLEGRTFTASDGALSPRVAVVNETFARQYFPNEDPVGHALVLGADPVDNPNPPPHEIVGVVGDVHNASLDVVPLPEVYVPVGQDTWPSVDLVVRERPGAHVDVRAAIAAVAPDEYTAEPRALADLVESSAGRREFTATLLGLFAAVALVLATVGIYGVMSYLVTRRSHEIGIRMALGASAGRIVRGVVGEGLALAGAGVAVGLAGAWALSRSLEGLLFGVGASDPATYVAVPLALVAVASVACAVPARRAARVDPTSALRDS